jgi:hypothetical protein
MRRRMRRRRRKRRRKGTVCVSTRVYMLDPCATQHGGYNAHYRL